MCLTVILITKYYVVPERELLRYVLWCVNRGFVTTRGFRTCFLLVFCSLVCGFEDFSDSWKFRVTGTTEHRWASKSRVWCRTCRDNAERLLDVGCRSEPSFGCTSTDSVYTLLVEIQLIKITDGTLLSALVFAKLPTFHILPIFYCTLQQQQFTSSSIFLQN
jgi:hypothetical protein